MSDQKLVESVSEGYSVLGDCLDWISTQKKLSVAKHARAVVEDHMKSHVPILTIEGYEALPGDLQEMVARMPKLPDDKSKRLMVFLLDFNIPGVSWLIGQRLAIIHYAFRKTGLIIPHVDPTALRLATVYCKRK